MIRKNYKDLLFFQGTKKITVLVYEATKKFPRDEQGFTGIVNQLRRACISSASNIAEGSSRKKKEYYHFLTLSLGSLREIETQIDISMDLGFLNRKEYTEISELISKTIARLCSYLRCIGKDAYNENKNSEFKSKSTHNID